MAEKLTMRPAQEASIAKALATPTKGVLDGSDMGAGKTAATIEIALRLNLPRVLIVAPRNTLKQWAEQFAAQSDGAVQLRRMDSTKAGQLAYEDFMAGEPGYYSATVQWLVTQNFAYSPAVDEYGEPIWKVKKSTNEVVRDKDGEPIQETLRTHLRTFYRKVRVDVTIFDEFHAIQNRNALATRTMRTIASDWRIGLSGTWHGNNFSGAYSTSDWVWPGLLPASYYHWLDEWAEMKLQCPRCFGDIEDRDATRCPECYLTFTRTKRPHQSVVGEKNPGEFVKSLPCYIRNEPFPQPPAALEVVVDMTPNQRAQYEDLEAQAVTWVQDHEGVEAPIVADLPIVLRQRLRTAALGEMSLDAEGEIHFTDDCKSAKLWALRGVLDEFDRQAGRKEKAVIFTDSKRFARVAAARMQAAGYRALLWTGDVGEKARERLKADFIEDRADYIVASIASLSEGVDGLQRACSKVVWLSRSENALLNQQSLRRVWRIGVDEEAFAQVDIVARGTLDDGTLRRLDATRMRNRAQMSINQEGSAA